MSLTRCQAVYAQLAGPGPEHISQDVYPKLPVFDLFVPKGFSQVFSGA
jgi:hypothetical protein